MIENASNTAETANATTMSRDNQLKLCQIKRTGREFNIE